MSKSSIEWTDATWNPIAGCAPVSPGCLNCYAAKMSHRLDGMGQVKYRGLTVLRNGRRTFNGTISFDKPALRIPLHRKKPAMYFVNSMSDLFHEDVPFEFVDRVFAVMALCPQHTFQILTKRPERMEEYLATSPMNRLYEVGRTVGAGIARMVENANRFHGFGGTPEYLPNVWLGTSVENQQCADERIPYLMKCRASVLFLSLEPLLGPIVLPEEFLLPDFADDDPRHTKKWVIVGGESGPGARACTIGHIREIVRQCQSAEIPCFVKQLGSHPVNREGVAHPAKDRKGGDIDEFPADLRVREFPASRGEGANAR